MLNRAMYGTKEAAQLSKTTVYSVRHGDDFATQIAEFKEDLSKQLLANHIATLGPRQQLLESCEVRILNRVLQWVVPPFGKAPERIEIEADSRHAGRVISQKFRFANKQQRSEYTRRASERQLTHSQIFTTRCCVIPF